mgnify:CR=1 FL=1
MMLLMIDNYDSFTYNLVQYFGELGADVQVFRNDGITPDEIERLAPARIVLSPGPCTPNEAGISMATIERYAGRIPILGVCLGHQAIGEAFGGRVVRAPVVMHGKLSRVRHDGRALFAELPQDFTVVRYHSLVVERESLPDCLAQMWAEGPGQDFNLHGHYINMSSSDYTKVACGFSSSGAGVWANQNFSS